MRTATIVSLICLAVALTGCGGSSGSVEFIAANSDSVLLDYSEKTPTDLITVSDTATQECQIFHRSTAVLESLNKRGEGKIRATYLCKSSIQSVDAGSGLRHRQ
jgi:hypothetical protein